MTAMLDSPNPPINATVDDMAFMLTAPNSSTTILIIPCLLFGGNISRKKVLIGSSIIYVMMWFVLCVFRSVTMMYIGWYFLGLTFNFQAILGNIYIGEIASPKNREILSIISILTFSIGKATQLALSSFNDYFILTMFPLTISLLILLISYWMQESPYYLVGVNSDERAKQATAWLLNESNEEKVEKELLDIKSYVQEDSADHLGVLKSFIKANNLKLFLFYTFINAAAFVNCDNAIENYGSQIINPLETLISGPLFMGVYSNLQIFCFLISFFVVKHFDRRSLLFFGFLVSAIIQILCATSFRIDEDNNYEVPFASYSILILLPFFLICYNILITSSLKILRTELYSYKTKVVSYVLMLVFQGIGESLQLGFFFTIADAYGQSANLFIYSVCAVAGTLAVFFLMRDTKNKSLLLIREEHNAYGLTYK